MVAVNNEETRPDMLREHSPPGGPGTPGDPATTGKVLPLVLSAELQSAALLKVQGIPGVPLVPLVPGVPGAPAATCKVTNTVLQVVSSATTWCNASQSAEHTWGSVGSVCSRGAGGTREARCSRASHSAVSTRRSWSARKPRGAWCSNPRCACGQETSS